MRFQALSEPRPFRRRPDHARMSRETVATGRHGRSAKSRSRGHVGQDQVIGIARVRVAHERARHVRRHQADCTSSGMASGEAVRGHVDPGRSRNRPTVTGPMAAMARPTCPAPHIQTMAGRGWPRVRPSTRSASRSGRRRTAARPLRCGVTTAATAPRPRRSIEQRHRSAAALAQRRAEGDPLRARPPRGQHLARRRHRPPFQRAAADRAVGAVRPDQHLAPRLARRRPPRVRDDDPGHGPARLQRRRQAAGVQRHRAVARIRSGVAGASSAG